MACSIEVDDVGDVKVISIAGDADLNSSEILQAAFEQAAAGQGGTIVVDLTGATLIDSRTIGVLAGWRQKQRSRGATMPVVCDDPNILRLFATIGLEREFQFVPTREAALEGPAPARG